VLRATRCEFNGPGVFLKQTISNTANLWPGLAFQHLTRLILALPNLKILYVYARDYDDDRPDMKDEFFDTLISLEPKFKKVVMYIPKEYIPPRVVHQVKHFGYQIPFV